MSERPPEPESATEAPTVADGTSRPPEAADPALVRTLRGLGAGHRVFDRFRLVLELGKGGMGVVWLAHDERLELEVALKFLGGMVSADAEALEDLRREITRGLALTHPGIVRLYDLHADGEGLAAIAMEYVAGSTLAEEKARRPDRCFDAPELVPLLRQLCEVLAYVHEKARVVHRDLKPRNLMLTGAGELKITDFGIAATLSDSHSRLTRLDTSGTPAYMSPQQANGQRPAASDDLYAIGATLYELLTGKPPFFRGAGTTILHQLLHEEPPPLAARREELGVTARPPVPPEWEETIAACLAKEPEQRPASVRELARRLLPGETLPGETEPEETLPTRVVPARAPPADPPRRLRIVPGTLAVLLLALVAGWLLAHRPGAGSAAGPEPPSDPMLRIEPGMHTSAISHLAMDRRGTLLLTTSRDKTARLWSIPAGGKLLQVLRPPIDVGREGMLLAGALSPDGSQAVVGGVTGLRWDKTARIYFFDTASGRLLRSLGGLPTGIENLAFSPDGKLLAAGLMNDGGLRLFEAASGRLVAQESAPGGGVLDVQFSPDGTRLAAAFQDETVRLYRVPASALGGPSAPLEVLASIKPGHLPGHLGFSPDGESLAIGAGDLASIAICSGHDLRFLFSPLFSGSKALGLLRCVTWSADGKTLYAAGTIHKSPGETVIRAWGNEGHGAHEDFVAAANTITDLLPAPAGGVVYAAFDPGWGWLDSHGVNNVFGKNPNADFRTNADNFRVSGDGSVVTFAFQDRGGKPARFSLLERKLTVAAPGELPSADPRLHPAKIDGLPITDWKTAPKLDGQPLKVAGRIHGLAIASDASFFVFASEFGLACFRADGSPLWSTGALAAVTAINLSNDGKIIVTSHTDGRIRWHRASDGRLLVSLYPHADEERWVLWTPESFYDASATGEELIGWQVNNGKDREGSFFPAVRYRDKYYRPDIVAHALDTSATTPAEDLP